MPQLYPDPGQDGRSHVWYYGLDPSNPWPDGSGRLLGSYSTTSPRTGTEGVDWVKRVSEKPINTAAYKVSDPGGPSQQFVALSSDELRSIKLAALQRKISDWPAPVQQAMLNLTQVGDASNIKSGNQLTVLRDLFTVLEYQFGLRF